MSTTTMPVPDAPVRDMVATAVLRGLVARDLRTSHDEHLVLTAQSLRTRFDEAWAGPR